MRCTSWSNCWGGNDGGGGGGAWANAEVAANPARSISSVAGTAGTFLILCIFDQSPMSKTGRGRNRFHQCGPIAVKNGSFENSMNHAACCRAACRLVVSPSVLFNSPKIMVDKTVIPPRTKNAR